LWTYQTGTFARHEHRPGDLAHLPRGTANGSKLRPGVWLLEYARGNVPSLFPFALGDTLFSTLDLTDLRHQLGVSTRLMLRAVVAWLKRAGQPSRPNFAALEALRATGKSRRRNLRRVDLN